MKLWRYAVLSLSGILLTLPLTGCGKKDTVAGHDHGVGKEEPGHEEGGAQFKEGKGISLSVETTKVLGVETAEVKEEQVERQVPVTLQVYRVTQRGSSSPYMKPGFAYASGFVSDEQAQRLKVGQNVVLSDSEKTIETNASIARIDLQIQPATHRSELVVEISDKEGLYPAGKFLQGVVNTGKTAVTTLIPKEALLPAAEGNFVYVGNGEFYFRTAVKVGATYNGSIGITEGLHPGDKVVTKPVESLWLIELRAVKGGGHSH